MALPTDFYVRTVLSPTLTVTRIKGGYLFTDKFGNNKSMQFVSDSEVSAPIQVIEGLPTSFYTRTILSDTNTVTRIEGGYLFADKQGFSTNVKFLSYSMVGG